MVVFVEKLFGYQITCDIKLKMKFDQQTLEIHALAHLVKNPKAMDKFLARGIKEDHFSYIGEKGTVYYTKELFKLIYKYWLESGGSLFTEYTLGYSGPKVLTS